MFWFAETLFQGAFLLSLFYSLFLSLMKHSRVYRLHGVRGWAGHFIHAVVILIKTAFFRPLPDRVVTLINVGYPNQQFVTGGLASRDSSSMKL